MGYHLVPLQNNSRGRREVRIYGGGKVPGYERRTWINDAGDASVDTVTSV